MPGLETKCTVFCSPCVPTREGWDSQKGGLGLDHDTIEGIAKAVLRPYQWIRTSLDRP
jgi:hypothetical protein